MTSARRHRHRVRLAFLGAALAGAVLASVAGCGFGPIGDRVTETQLAPQVIRLLGDGGDPLVVMVGVAWTKDGYCSGQFTVQATESATEVDVGPVTSRQHSSGACAGLGSDDNMAWAELRLTSPLGDRAVLRSSDGFSLPVRAP